MAADVAYLDASTLVNRYVAEEGTEAVQGLLTRFAVTGTATLTQVTAALAKAVRMGDAPARRSDIGFRALSGKVANP